MEDRRDKSKVENSQGKPITEAVLRERWTFQILGPEKDNARRPNFSSLIQGQ